MPTPYLIDKIDSEDLPHVELVGVDSNIAIVMATCTKALTRSGRRDLADELRGRVLSSGSYDEALSLCVRYVNAF